MREHHRQPEISRQRLDIGLLDVHQFALVADPALAEQYVGMKFRMFALVPYLAGPHALQVDVFLLLGNIDRQQLRRHLLDRHVHALGGVAPQCVLLFPLLVVACKLLLDLAEGAFEDDFPALEASLAGNLAGGTRRPARPASSAIPICRRILRGSDASSISCHASGGGGTTERPVSTSTIEPSAGQYIRQAVQPG